MGLYFVDEFELTATIETVEFIKFVHDDLLGRDMYYEKYIECLTEIRNKSGCKKFKKLNPGTVNYQWINKNRSNRVLLFHHALKIQDCLVFMLSFCTLMHISFTPLQGKWKCGIHSVMV